MKNQVNLALMGFGVVGSGTLQLLRQHKRNIESRVGARLNVLWVCSRTKKKAPYLNRDIGQTTNWRKAVTDPRVDCVVELFGGIQPALSLVTTALKTGKHVVTANKALLSKHWDVIMALAHKHMRLVYFEASVGGGVPVVQALNEGLAGNRVFKIIGILNGTTNFILTQMEDRALSFDEALEEAKKRGFAEADPSFDIEGIDAAQKVSILSSLAIGQWIKPSQVHCEGITHIQAQDIRLIRHLFKCHVKLLAIAEKRSTGWIFRVHPTLIPESHPFANVRNEYNAISLYGNAVDDVMIYGKGAGRLPTSSAVISDIIFLCRQIAMGTAGQLPYVTSLNGERLHFSKLSQIRCRYYLRVRSLDHPGVLSKITGILGEHHVSIDSIHQDAQDKQNGNKGVPIILLTHENLEANVQASVRAIDRLPSTVSKTVLLRML